MNVREWDSHLILPGQLKHAQPGTHLGADINRANQYVPDITLHMGRSCCDRVAADQAAAGGHRGILIGAVEATDGLLHNRELTPNSVCNR